MTAPMIRILTPTRLKRRLVETGECGWIVPAGSCDPRLQAGPPLGARETDDLRSPGEALEDARQTRQVFPGDVMFALIVIGVAR